METFLQSLADSNPWWAYAMLFLSAFVENIFPPIPGDTVVLLGAYLVGRGILNSWQVYASTTAGSIAGFMGMYGIAYWIEWKVIEKYQPRWLSRTKIDRVESWFQRYGYWVILLNRFLSGVRSVISVVAGLSKLDARRVFLLGMISCMVWNALLIYAGALLGRNWQEIGEFLKMYNRVVIILLMTAGGSYILYRFVLYRRK